MLSALGFSDGSALLKSKSGENSPHSKSKVNPPQQGIVIMMRRLCLGLSLPLVLGAAQGGEWKTFSPKGGGYSVQMPGDPVEDKQDVKAAGGETNIAVTFYVFEVKGEGSLVVSQSEFPDAIAKAGDAEKRLNGARAGAVTSSKGKLRAEKKIALDSNPGRDLLIENEMKNTLVRTRVYAVGNRLYQTIAAGKKEFVEGKTADRFLDSFKLVK